VNKKRRRVKGIKEKKIMAGGETKTVETGDGRV